MAHSLYRFLTVAALATLGSGFSAVACTRTTDRVVEPVGASDASTPSHELDDAGLNPLTPIALPPEEPKEDFRLVRANELGSGIEHGADGEQVPGVGGANGSGGAAGGGGSDRRPVSNGTARPSYW